MATQLQLYRLGFDEPVSKETYENVKQKYKGALIFAKVQEYKDAEHKFNKSETGVQKGERNGQFFETTKTTIIGDGEEVIETEYNLGMPSYYIYANGIEYKVANADALEVVFNQVKILNGGEETEGSVRYIVEKAIKNLKFDANKFYEIVDHTKSNVDVSVVEGTDTSLLVLTAPGTDLVVKTGTDTPENEWPKHLEKPEVEGVVVEQPSDIWPAPQKGYYYIQTTPVIGTNDEYLSSSDAITKNRANAEKGTEDYQDYKVDSHKTAFIYDGEKWMALDGNVSADNVYFQDGIQRTAQWGVKDATKDGAIAREGINYNLKEYLEYMLLEEIYPPCSVSQGECPTPAAYTLSIGRPSDLSTYFYEVNSIDDLASATKNASTTTFTEVGKKYGFKMEPITQTITYNDNIEYINGTASKITGMTYGSADALDGEKHISITSKESNKPVCYFTYSDNFSNEEASQNIASATLNFQRTKGFTGMQNSAETIEGLNQTNATISISSDIVSLGTIIEGTNSASLVHSCTAYASRSIDADRTTNLSKIDTTYIISNKGNVSKDNTKSTEAKTWSNANSNANIANATKNISIIGVYPFFTNGVEDKSYKSANEFAQLVTISDNEETRKTKKLNLKNYTTKTTFDYYINFWKHDEGESTPLEFYVPASTAYKFDIKFTGLNGSSYDTDNGAADLQDLFQKQAQEISIDGVDVKYIVYRLSTGNQGAQSVRVRITPSAR